MKKKDIWKIASIILGMLIVAVIVGGVSIMLSGKDGDSTVNNNPTTKEELTATLPENKDTKVKDSITIGSGADSSSSSDEVKNEETAEEELSEEEKAAVEETVAEEEQQTSSSNVVVEDEVTKIREKYSVIVSGISGGSYSEVSLESGKTAYYDGSALMAVIVKKNVDGNSYSKSYYYDNQKLMFAYYEGSDAHRFYFYGGELMRWRYSKNASNAQDAVNHDWESTDEYQKWAAEVWSDGMSYL